MLSLGIKAQNISFSDPNFRTKLLSSSPSNTVAKNLSGNYFAIDTNGDGNISKDEAEKVSELDVSNSSLYSLEGISHFKNIIKLDCSLNNTYFLDLQGLDNLQTVKCNNSSINGIFLQYDLNLKNIDCSNNLLKYINLSNLPSLININVSGNNLSGLSFQDGIANNIQSLNITNNPLLSNICKDASDTLPSTGSISQAFCNSPVIDPIFTQKLLSANATNMIAKNISDQYFKIDSNNDGILQTTELAQIKELHLDNNPSTFESGSSINTFGMTNLKMIIYNGEGQYNMGNTSLHGWGHLYDVDLKGSPNLEYIEFNDQPLIEIDVSNLPFLHTLQMNLDIPNGGANGGGGLPASMKLRSLNAENCSSLTNIGLMYQNALEIVNLKNCSALTSFNHNNDGNYNMGGLINNVSYPPYWSLKEVNLENCMALTSVNVSKTKLTHLNVKNCPALAEIRAYECQISTADNILNG
ncbi:hypothetical protein GCM10022217_18150 [Chryseobacterium ginsenosidimutans]